MAKHKSVKLLLLENVENLGIVGDVVKVKPGYARNFLVPFSFATVPTAHAMKQVEERRKEVERQLAEERKRRQELIAKLEGVEITIQRSANEQGILFGSVTNFDIVQALAEEGLHVTERDIRIGGPIKQLDSYEVPIVFDKELHTAIKLWVVSDKPIEEISDESEEGESADSSEETPTTADA